MNVQPIATAGPARSEASSVPAKGIAATGATAASSQAAATPAAGADEPSAQELSSAVDEINKKLQASSQNIEFSIDTDSKRTIVKIVDQSTKEVLRQIPTTVALEIAKSIDKMRGLLISNEA
jgi:flagellar protein FlaG